MDKILAKEGFICDMDGVIYHGKNILPGASEFVNWMIENGKKTIPVKSFTVAGNFYDLLKGITLVADNMELPRAMGMTAFGSPTVLVEGLSIAGK